MDRIFLVLITGVAGWLTGKLIGEQSYGKTLTGHAAVGLDTVFGIVGGSIGSYLFFWAVVGEGGSLSRYGTAVLGAITLVAVARIVFARSFRLAYTFRQRGAGLKAQSR
jgi:uncharacterized membrane protein YeaQ/YmgE (transglycosylase-associated protein family)